VGRERERWREREGGREGREREGGGREGGRVKERDEWDLGET
jgi:hypothetical protein